MAGGSGASVPDDLEVRATDIPGLLVVHLVVHEDARGWFKENWQREKMVALGLPDLGPVQHSASHNVAAGVTRGIHAEPWDKFVSVVHGKVFCAFVDLREGPTFGTVHTEELDEHTAVFVPRGVGNSYQTLVDDVVYSYLVNDHWSPHATYTMLNVADETVAIGWPIPLDRAELSEKDRAHPRLGDVTPMPARRTLVLGRGGQLGRALARRFPRAEVLGVEELDLSDAAAVAAYDFSGVGVVLNAAAYTAVDQAETPEGRRAAWAVNAVGVAALARAALKHHFTLVHYSTDYVFDGADEVSTEDSPLAPLGVYGQSKAAGDLAVSVVPRHYLLRTSWVVGEGANFVAAMRSLAERGVSPTVVDDQVGRLTTTQELAEATAHLLSTGAPFGTYNVTGDGEPRSFAAIARDVFAKAGRSPDDVTPVTTQEYAAAQEGRPFSARPRNSTLSLDRLHATGYPPSAPPLPLPETPLSGGPAPAQQQRTTGRSPR